MKIYMDLFDFRPVNHCEISRKLKMLISRKSNGYDNIPAKLLGVAHVELTSPVSKLIINVMQMNVHPETMKCAELSPIYKRDDNALKVNFRPVSVLTVVYGFVKSFWLPTTWSYHSKITRTWCYNRCLWTFILLSASKEAAGKNFIQKWLDYII